MKIILASSSPRRKELLRGIVNNFEIIPATGEERVNLSLFPEQIACQLAEAKCDEVFGKYPNCLVIGCDTVVAYGGKIFGKPKDEEDARQTLKLLSGKTHLVITGVCVRSPKKKLVKFERSEVRFNHLTDQFIEEYVAGGSPMDKAGSYGIQDKDIVKEHYGSYTNVVGLPVALVKNMIEEVLSDE